MRPVRVAYITGRAHSSDFPVTSAAFQRTIRNPFGTGFVSAVSSDGSGLIYSTYLGGGPLEGACVNQGLQIAADAVGEAFVTSQTCSNDFPVTPGAFQTINRAYPNMTIAVTKLSSDGSSLAYSTYLGGSGFESLPAIAIDRAGNAYVGGSTYSGDFPVTSGAYQVTPSPSTSGTGFATCFSTKLNPAGTALVYSTYLGPITPYFYGIASGISGIGVDVVGHLYVTGAENWLKVLNAAGSGLNYTSAITAATPQGIAVDGSGNAYLVGNVYENSIPITPGAFQQTNYNGQDGRTPFVAKFALSNTTTTTITSSANPQASGENVTLTAHVAPVMGNGVPTGVVHFSQRDSDTIAVELDGSGNASYTTPYLPVGANPLTATYFPTSGEVYQASASSFTQNITGQLVAPIFTPAGGTITGPIHVLIETSSPGATIRYTTNGTTPGPTSAQYTSTVPVTAPLTTIKAIAFANGNTASAASTAVYTIAPQAIATTTKLQSLVNPATQGQTVTLVARVSAASGPTPTGSVIFKHGIVEAGSAPLVNGVATFTTSSLPPNTYNFLAIYTGSATDDSSTTPTAVVQQVTAD